MIEPHRAPKIDINKIEINQSSISMYLKCARQYKFRYVDKLKDKPGIALLEGSSHHKALEHNNLHKRKTARDLKPKQLTETFIEDLRLRVKEEGGAEGVEWNGEDENKLHTRAKALHVDYMLECAPLIKPEMVEEKFEKVVKVDGIEITLFGTVDLTIEGAVLDYKTTSKAKSQSEVDNSLQGTLYMLAAKKPDFGMVQLVKTSNPYTGILMSHKKRTAQDILWGLRVAKEVALAIQSEQFPMCDPASWACQPRWCGYYSRCRGAK